MKLLFSVENRKHNFKVYTDMCSRWYFVFSWELNFEFESIYWKKIYLLFQNRNILNKFVHTWTHSIYYAIFFLFDLLKYFVVCDIKRIWCFWLCIIIVFIVVKWRGNIVIKCCDFLLLWLCFNGFYKSIKAMIWFCFLIHKC